MCFFPHLKANCIQRQKASSIWQSYYLHNTMHLLLRSVPLFGEGSHDFCAAGVVSSTHPTLVILELGSDDPVTARSDALPSDTD